MLCRKASHSGAGASKPGYSMGVPLLSQSDGLPGRSSPVSRLTTPLAQGSSSGCWSSSSPDMARGSWIMWDHLTQLSAPRTPLSLSTRLMSFFLVPVRAASSTVSWAFLASNSDRACSARFLSEVAVVMPVSSLALMAFSKAFPAELIPYSAALISFQRRVADRQRAG